MSFKENVMGLLSFPKDTGKKLLYEGPARQNAQAQLPDSSSAASQDKEHALGQAILDYMALQNLPIQDLTLSFDASIATVFVKGSVPDQETRDKIILCCGNVQGVAYVDDEISFPSSQMH
jgi:hypothetical protein